MKSPAPSPQDNHGHPTEDDTARPTSDSPEGEANREPLPRRSKLPKANHHQVAAQVDDDIRGDRQDPDYHRDHSDGVDGDRDEVPVSDNHDDTAVKSSLDLNEFAGDPKRVDGYATEFGRRAACHWQSVLQWHRWYSFLSLRTVRRGFVQVVNAGLLVKTGRVPV